MASEGIHIGQPEVMERGVDYSVCFAPKHIFLVFLPPPKFGSTLHCLHGYLLVSQMIQVLSLLPVTTMLNGLQAARQVMASS